MKRRDFLNGLGVATVAPLVAACASAFRMPLDIMARPEDGPGTDRDTKGHWKEGVAYARWAPSPHNVQPWRMRVISETRAELLYDPVRLLPQTDPTSTFTVMGLAMFVEYLRIALLPRGVHVLTDYVYEPLDYTATKPKLFATLELVDAIGAPTVDRKLILERKTSRLPYDNWPVEEESMRALAAIASTHGQTLEWSSDKSMIDWMADLNRYTLFEDLDDAATRKELRQWIRTSDDEAAAKKDGLWSHCLRFPGWLLKAFFDDHEKWGRGWRKKLCGNMLVNGMHGTRTVAWWSGPLANPEQWIRAGTMLGHSWLEMTRRGLSLHPFGSVITNPKAHARLRERIPERDDDNKLWLVFRIGRSDTAPRSYRIDEREIFLSDATPD